MPVLRVRNGGHGVLSLAQIAAGPPQASPVGCSLIVYRINVPGLVRVRLIPPGTVDSMREGSLSKPGFAVMALLKVGETTGKPPFIEAHFLGMEMVQRIACARCALTTEPLSVSCW
jgi:hypothetical protein